MICLPSLIIPWPTALALVLFGVLSGEHARELLSGVTGKEGFSESLSPELSRSNIGDSLENVKRLYARF